MTEKERLAKAQEIQNEIKEKIIELLDIYPELLSINYGIDQETDVSLTVGRYTKDWWSIGLSKYYYGENRESIPERYWIRGARTLKEVEEMERADNDFETSDLHQH